MDSILSVSNKTASKGWRWYIKFIKGEGIKIGSQSLENEVFLEKQLKIPGRIVT